MCCECVDWISLASDREVRQQWICDLYKMWKFSSLLIDTIRLLHLHREIQNIIYTYPYNKKQQDASGSDCTDISRCTVNKALKKKRFTYFMFRVPCFVNLYYNIPTKCSCSQSILFHCRVTLHVSGAFHTHQEYIKLYLQPPVQVILSLQLPSSNVAEFKLGHDGRR